MGVRKFSLMLSIILIFQGIVGLALITVLYPLWVWYYFTVYFNVLCSFGYVTSTYYCILYSRVFV